MLCMVNRNANGYQFHAHLLLKSIYYNIYIREWKTIYISKTNLKQVKKMGQCLRCGFDGIRVVCDECGHSQIVTKVSDFDQPFYKCGCCMKVYPVGKNLIRKARKK